MPDVIYAVLKTAGTQPVFSERFNSSVKKGARTSMTDLSVGVGRGSRATTSSMVTGSKQVKWTWDDDAVKDGGEAPMLSQDWTPQLTWRRLFGVNLPHPKGLALVLKQTAVDTTLHADADSGVRQEIYRYVNANENQLAVLSSLLELVSHMRGSGYDYQSRQA